jgi:hypothetical protein
MENDALVFSPWQGQARENCHGGSKLLVNILGQKKELKTKGSMVLISHQRRKVSDYTSLIRVSKRWSKWGMHGIEIRNLYLIIE